MPDPKANALVKAVGALASEKEDITGRVESLIGSLGSELERIGYRIVPMDGVLPGKRRGRPPGRPAAANASPAQAPKKRGRPAMSAAERRAQSRRMKAYWAKRKRKAEKKG